MALILLTRRNVAALKSSLLKAFPDIGSGHADEALASGIGFRTHAALLAALKAQGGGQVTVLLNEQTVGRRVKELTGNEPELLQLSTALWIVLPDPTENRLGIGDWWRHVANEN